MEKKESRFKGKSPLIKNILIGILVGIILVLAIKIGISSDDSIRQDGANPGQEVEDRPFLSKFIQDNVKNKDVCLNKACISAANSLLENMNLNADPCEDFNEFACGNFIKNTIIPDDKGRFTSFTPLGDKILERGRVLLEEEVKDSEWEVVKMAKNYYKSCMNKTKLEELGVSPILDELKEVGGWPILEGELWNAEGEFKWYERVYEMSHKGWAKNTIVSLSISTDYSDSTRRVIFVDQPSLGMSREYLIKGSNDSDVNAYYEYMIGAAKLLGADEDTARADLKESLEFEIKLANISAPREERRNITKLNNLMKIEDLPNYEGHPPSWYDYINNVYHAVNLNMKHDVILKNPKFHKDLATLLKKTDNRTLANYLGWRMVKSSMTILNQAALDIRHEYRKMLYGVQQQTPRWKKCVKNTGFGSANTYGAFEAVASSLYVQRHFPPSAKKNILDMIGYIRNSFKAIVKNLDWMDEGTKTRAMEKLGTMFNNVGYPDELLSKKAMSDLYKEVMVIEEEQFFKNDLRMSRWSRRKTMDSLFEVVDKKDWRDRAAIALVNAFYYGSYNMISFPAGILQGVFFEKDVPKYLNYGGIGSVIGHEITHGFDDRGRQRDKDGNLNDWWGEKTKEHYLEKVQCIIDQYSNYTVIGLNVNGKNGQGENIADNGGLKEAYMGYENWVRENEPEPKLPGLPFTPKQLFWINWGQVWCAKSRESALKNKILTAYHSPNMFRIIGPLSNFKEFSEDFACKPKSPMNPEKKCTVW